MILLFGISGGEILIVLLLVLLLFGPKKIPEIARAIGKGMNEVKKVQRDINAEINRYSREIENPAKQITEDLEGFKKGLNDEVAQTLGHGDSTNQPSSEALAEENPVKDEEFELPYPYNISGNPAAENLNQEISEESNEKDTPR
jgi:sec-independent protein translocase protein TatA